MMDQDFCVCLIKIGGVLYMLILIIRILGLYLSITNVVTNYKSKNLSAVLGWICSSLLWPNLIVLGLR